MAFTAFDGRVIQLSAVQILNAQGTTPQVITQGLQYGTQINQLLASNNDAIAHVVEFSLDDNATDIVAIGAVNVPSGAGFTGPAVDVIAALLPTTTPYINLPPVNKLRARLQVAATLTNEVDIWGGGVQF